MTDNFAAIRKALDKKEGLGADVELVSISIDPDFDTPAVMREYALRYATPAGALPSGWEFATGTPDEVRKVAESYGLVYRTENDQIVHSLRTAVISPDGMLVKVYRGNEWKPSEVVSDLEALAGA